MPYAQLGVLSGWVVGSIGVDSGFEILKFDPQPDQIRNRVIGFGLSGRVIRVVGL